PRAAPHHLGGGHHAETAVRRGRDRRAAPAPVPAHVRAPVEGGRGQRGRPHAYHRVEVPTDAVAVRVIRRQRACPGSTRAAQPGRPAVKKGGVPAPVRPGLPLWSQWIVTRQGTACFTSKPSLTSLGTQIHSQARAAASPIWSGS